MRITILLTGLLVAPVVLFAAGAGEEEGGEHARLVARLTPVERELLSAQPAPERFPIERSDEQWQAILDPLPYNVLRRSKTERAFTGELNSNTMRGTYYSAATGEPLFHSDSKYDSGTGWPSFTNPHRS